MRLLELPQGLFAVSMATFLLPTLAGLAAEKKYDDFRGQLDEAARHLLFVNLPAAALLFVLAEPIVQLLFQYGEFTQAATERAAWALRCLAPALPGYSLVLILGRAFYALGEVKTPVRISVFCLGLNLVLALAMVFQLTKNWRSALWRGEHHQFHHERALLWITLSRRKELTGLKLPGLSRQLPAMLMMAAAALGLAYWLHESVAAPAEWGAVPQRLWQVFIPLLGAGLVYWLLAAAMGVDSAQSILKLFRRKTKKSLKNRKRLRSCQLRVHCFNGLARHGTCLRLGPFAS